MTGSRQRPPRLGEVLAASTTQAIAQALPLPGAEPSVPTPPAFGSFVRIAGEEGAPDAFGVVCHAETGPLDGAHRPTALNLSRRELREQQPQVFELLRTDFTVQLCAHRTDAGLRLHLPPAPPAVHSFVYRCSPEEVAALTADWSLLRGLASCAVAPVDELLAACVREACRACGDDGSQRLAAARALAGLLRHDYARLSALLARLAPDG